MATLEDKILGEKLQYYCSSSEDEAESNDSDDREEDNDKFSDSLESNRYLASAETKEWDGTSSNTGPKGVLKDWQRFKQLEAEKREMQKKERLQLIKKLSLTCRSALDDEKEKLKESDPDLAELLADEFLLEYQKQRMREMLDKAEKLRFGKIVDLTDAEKFLEAIDNEDKNVTVVIHIYENNVPGCTAMNGCLISLAQEYPFVKFCKILGSTAGLSKHFRREGVPALLVYKNGQIIGNFVRVTENLGSDFYSSDVESFLIENGILNDKNCVPPVLGKNQNADSDSD